MNYLSHLVGRALRLTQPLEPARGNPFEPAQAREPAPTDFEPPEQPITQRLRPARIDASAPAVASAEPAPEAQPAMPVAARFDEVLAQVPPRAKLSAGVPAHPSASPPGTPLSSEAEGAPLAVSETAAEHGMGAPAEGKHSPASRLAAASEVLRRPTASVPLQPARTETAKTAVADLFTPAPHSTQRGSGRAAQLREHLENKPAVETRADVAQRLSTDEALPVSQLLAPRLTTALTPMSRASPPPAIAGATASLAATADVHISIGSVEIRAQTSPARAKPVSGKPRASRPSMSLGDYLQKRGGGR